MAAYKASGVYVEESGVASGGIAEVPSGVPGFVGYTEFASDESGGELWLVPTRVRSVLEFERCFGGASADLLRVAVSAGGGGPSVVVTPAYPHYLLHFAVRSFFDNGGGVCYVTSVGAYRKTPAFRLRGTSSRSTRYGLLDGLEVLAGVDEVSLVVIPEAVRLSAGDYGVLVRAVLAQCGQLRDRFAILDLYGGGGAMDSAALAANRELLGSEWLSYGAAYYPFVRSTYPLCVNAGETNVTVTVGRKRPMRLARLKSADPAAYAVAKAALQGTSVLLPVSGGVAGVYAATDAARGVWKAPANVALAGVRGPAVAITGAQQGSLNVDPVGGKSVNAIRSFPGKGTVVWGARTLAGNDNEWRYVPVRRLLIMVEESVTKGTQWVIFEPNTAATWARVRGMIEVYLTGRWRDGALVGTKPEQAFYVRCGLGATMTEQDLAEGRLIVEIGMAVVRPAEFISLRFTHQMKPCVAGLRPVGSVSYVMRFGDAQAAFAKVGGLAPQLDPVGDYRLPEGRLRKLAGTDKHGTVTLERGMTRDITLAKWLATSAADGGVERRDLLVTLFDEHGCPGASWRIHKAWPVKYVGPALNARGNEVVIESVELTHEGIELVPGDGDDD